jgi:hypothetical protein
MVSNVHFYLNWAKERIDEMDAVLTSLQSRATQVSAESRAAADQLVADLRSKRDAFQNDLRRQAEAGEAAWAQSRAKLESDWNAFQADVKKYVEDFGRQMKQQQTTFQDIAAAQLKAWREAADRFQAAAADLAVDRRARMEATVQQMKADASAAEANFQKLAKAGTESWAALSAALTDSRAAFDRANRTAWDAFKRATSGE